jgi:hypothetical protein
MMNEAFAASHRDIALAIKAGNLVLTYRLANAPIALWEPGGALHQPNTGESP